MHGHDSAPEAAARTLIAGLERDWNRGDMDAYLAAYRRDHELVLAMGNQCHRGWDTMRALYRSAYPDPHAMGTFRVLRIETRVLDPRTVIASGTFEHRFPDLFVSGAFTQVIGRDVQGGWQILSEHTSRARGTEG